MGLDDSVGYPFEFGGVVFMSGGKDVIKTNDFLLERDIFFQALVEVLGNANCLCFHFF